MTLKLIIYKLCATLCLLSVTLCNYAQDIEQVAKSKPVTVKGGVVASGSFYDISGGNDMRDPYFWQVMANLNFNFWGVINMPFSAYFAKRNVRYQQPSFEQFGLSPKYKSITLHLGYRSMVFSNYSLGGLTFLGAGIDYQPDKHWLKASAMYGRFFKAVPYADSVFNTFEDPSYERWGGGFKVTAEKNNQEISVIVFKAADKIASIPEPPIGSNLKPAENFITGFTLRNRLTNSLTLRTEYTLSAYTPDIRNQTKEFDQYTYLNNLGTLFTPKHSSTLGKAFELNIDYQIDFIALGLAYKRIDPNYKSLGSTFIENDIEDILFNISKPLFNKKLNLNGSIGRQRNNLDGSKETEDKRVIGSLSGSLQISQSLNFNVNYSNFTSSSQPTLINFTDSIRYFQINKNSSYTLSYNKGNEKLRQGITCMVAFQQGRSLNRSATMELENKNNMVNGNISYNISFLPVTTTLVVALQASQFKNSLNKTTTYGPNIAVTRGLFKGTTNLSFAYSFQLCNLPDNTMNNNHIFRLNTDFRIDKFQSVNFYVSNLLRRKTGNTDIATVTTRELQAGLSYQFNF